MMDQSVDANTTSTGKQYVRTFLFSMRLGAPLNRLHFITKFVSVLLLSFVIIKAMDEQNPDPILAGFFFMLSLVAILLGGVSRWVFRSYMVLIFPMFLFLFTTWIIFFPDPGTHTYVYAQIYSGTFIFDISVASATFVAITILHYLLTKKFLRGLLIGLIVAVLLDQFTTNPGVTLFSFQFLNPYYFVLSDRNILVAGTKVLGYAAMVFNTLMLVMTTRDNELTAAFYQLRVPKYARFFLSIFFRTLNISLLDFETIRQAQVARGVRIREHTIFELLRNTARMAVPLVATMFQRSNEISDALLARGFSLDKSGREFLEIQPMKGLDWLILLLIIAFMVVYFVFPFNVSNLIFEVAG